MTFRQFLLSQKHRNTAIGDLARDFARDHCAVRLHAPTTVIAHIMAHDPSPEAQAALHQAHDQWLKAVAA